MSNGQLAWGCLFSLVFLAAMTGFVSCRSDKGYRTWESAGGSRFTSIRYSSLDQIDTSNVHHLEIAWEYRPQAAGKGDPMQIQCNPIVIGNRLYATTARLELFSLDAATGRELWIFDPFEGQGQRRPTICRGAVHWKKNDDERIFFTAGSWLYALDALSGRPVESFGDHGKVDLHEGLGERAKTLGVAATTPGVIFGDLLIIGSSVSEGPDAAPGHIRAFNTITGKLAWVFHTIPQPGDPGYESWEDKDAWKTTGGANSWAGMSLDRERGMVFIPTGSASPDFYGGFRKGSNLFANCILALEAATGRYVWHFQTVHHDLWDRDLPSAPGLVTVMHNGKETDAVAQATKTGHVFLLDRETGRPLFDVEEVKVPDRSLLEGEKPWPSQPFPVKPDPFMRQRFDEDDVNRYASPEDRDSLKNLIRQLDNGNLFDPPSLKGSVMFPGFDGGAEWGGNAFDPESGVIYINSNEIPWTMTMVNKKKAAEEAMDFFIDKKMLRQGEVMYRKHCTACHGQGLTGPQNVPSLEGVGSKYSVPDLIDIISSGRRAMPAFIHLADKDKRALAGFLSGKKSERDASHAAGDSATDGGVPYEMTGYKKMVTSEGYPANNPPWGTLNAIDLNEGKTLWRIPLGEYAGLTTKGIPVTGTENYGGPVVTAGGLVFIAATPDAKIRAFDKASGRLLWQASLPAAGFATPACYEAKGRQYLVIACGGGKLGAEPGNSYVAFALPDNPLR